MPGWAWPLVGAAGMLVLVVVVGVITYAYLTVRSNR